MSSKTLAVCMAVVLLDNTYILIQIHIYEYIYCVYTIYVIKNLGWMQGSGVVGQHPILTVARLLSPLIIIPYGPCCILARRTTHSDD